MQNSLSRILRIDFLNSSPYCMLNRPVFIYSYSNLCCSLEDIVYFWMFIIDTLLGFRNINMWSLLALFVFYIFSYKKYKKKCFCISRIQEGRFHILRNWGICFLSILKHMYCLAGCSWNLYSLCKSCWSLLLCRNLLDKPRYNFNKITNYF